MIELFNFHGRTSRLRYWRVLLLAVVLVAAVLCAGYAAILSVGPAGGVVFVAMAPIVVIVLAVTLRRLHDRGKDVRWLLLFQGVPLVCSALAQEMVRSGAVVAQTESVPLSLVSLGVSLWGLIEIGFLRGQPAANRFGEPPAPGR